MSGAKFPLGQVVSTPGALELLERSGVAPAQFLGQHSRGDWGDVCAEDAKANEHALLDGSRIFSVYMISGEKLWIITEADRASTCLLLPSEY